MPIFLLALFSSLAVSLVSFIGAFALALQKEKLQNFLIFLVSLSVGGLMGDAFIHLLPESFELLPPLTASLLCLVGILVFFLLEKMLRWRHCHDSECEKHYNRPLVFMNLWGDMVHNAIDGLMIGASYLVSVDVGLTTTLAVILHEIPQEIGDFGVLLHSGLKISRALLVNFISGAAAILGTLLVLILEEKVSGFSQFLIPVAAGGFIYIAGSDLMPELHRENDAKKSFLQLVFMLTGIALMFSLLVLE
ncbi:MAG TPA: ZIP family metal transporter [Candidatus Pacearchaeota archaeon]|nr:ZIP family metal transporter [Candidatus Pacearchaeota archaeon]